MDALQAEVVARTEQIIRTQPIDGYARSSRAAFEKSAIGLLTFDAASLASALAPLAGLTLDELAECQQKANNEARWWLTGSTSTVQPGWANRSPITPVAENWAATPQRMAQAGTEAAWARLEPLRQEISRIRDACAPYHSPEYMPVVAAIAETLRRFGHASTLGIALRDPVSALMTRIAEIKQHRNSFRMAAVDAMTAPEVWPSALSAEEVSWRVAFAPAFDRTMDQAIEAAEGIVSAIHATEASVRTAGTLADAAVAKIQAIFRDEVLPEREVVLDGRAPLAAQQRLSLPVGWYRRSLVCDLVTHARASALLDTFRTSATARDLRDVADAVGVAVTPDILEEVIAWRSRRRRLRDPSHTFGEPLETFLATRPGRKTISMLLDIQMEDVPRTMRTGAEL